MLNQITKYPSTPHLEGSRIQTNDSKIVMPYSELKGRYIVVEEKMDGANSGVSIDTNTFDVVAQSRGHYLIGGKDDAQFDLLKQWVWTHQPWMLELLDEHFVMYGEWMYLKHSIFYDNLPHYFLEFDIFDKRDGKQLSTNARREMLKGLPVLSVPVLYEGPAPDKLDDLIELIKFSKAKTYSWKHNLNVAIERRSLNADLTLKQTDPSDLGEGLYIKIEEGDQTIGRVKLVRESFTQTILDSGSHYSSRPKLPNMLHEGVNIFAEQLTHTWNNI